MRNVSRKAQDKVEAVRKLLDGLTVVHREAECADCKRADECMTLHFIPDPAYAGLRELVEEECQGICLEVSPESCECRGTLRVTRDWTGSPRGSLWGAALERLEANNDDGEMVFEAIYYKIGAAFDREVRKTLDRDLAIMTALEAALTAQLEAANAIHRSHSE